MARRPPPTAVLVASPDEIEAQFYEALQHGNLEQLMAVWADDDDIVCVHPGGARLVGTAAIRAGFESLFSNGGLRVSPERLHRLHTVSSAVHHLAERITAETPQGVQTGWIWATNVYIKTAQGWRLVAHHASPANADDIGDDGQVAFLH